MVLWYVFVFSINYEMAQKDNQLSFIIKNLVRIHTPNKHNSRSPEKETREFSAISLAHLGVWPRLRLGFTQMIVWTLLTQGVNPRIRVSKIARIGRDVFPPHFALHWKCHIHLAGLYIKVPVMQPTLVSPCTSCLRASHVHGCKTLALRYCDVQIIKKKKLFSELHM